MKYKVKDLEQTKKVYGSIISMRSVIVDESDNIVSTSPFGSMNEKFVAELDKCEKKDDVLELTDKYFYGRLLEGIYKEMGVK